MENKVDASLFMTDQMKAVLAKSTELAENAFDTNAGFEGMRENYVRERRFWNEGGPVMAKTIDQAFEGPMGAFNVRFYYPVEAEKLPAIAYIHGGGFVVGNCDTHDRVCRIIAEKTGAVVASIDYHLSPESKFPVNIQECALVAKHLHEHGAEMGIDGNDISFAGDSGGAVLSLATTLWLRDEEGDCSFIKALLLYYGFYGLADSTSYRLFGWEFDGMRKEDLDYYMACWLTNVDEELSSPYIDMLHNDLKTAMPPCYIAAAGLDPLRDDSECLAGVLRTNGIDCEHEVFAGVLHAFIHYTRMLDEANECLDHSALFWKERRRA